MKKSDRPSTIAKIPKNVNSWNTKNSNVQLPFAIPEGSEVHAGEEAFRRTCRKVEAFRENMEKKKMNEKKSLDNPLGKFSRPKKTAGPCARWSSVNSVLGIF